MKLKLINLEFEGGEYQWYHFIVNNNYRAMYSVKGWVNGKRRDINVPVFSCWLRDVEFKELDELGSIFYPSRKPTIEEFLYELLAGATSCNFEDELTLYLSYMFADRGEKDGD